jgi:hypothetical protein
MAPLAAALVMVVGVGCSPSDPCAACTSDQVCEAGVCKAKTPDACLGKPACPAGTGCDPANGQCRDLCTGKTCPAGEGCKKETGVCGNLCEGAAPCTNPAKECSPTTGLCEDKCKAGTCPEGQACVATAPAAQRCQVLCESASQPVGKAACASYEKCETATGNCVSKCAGVTCPGSVTSPQYAQHCNPETGRCETGKPPAGTVGAACTGDEACNRIALAAGQESSCLGDIDGDGTPEFSAGYCSASCSASVPCPPGAFCLQGFGCLDKCLKKADCAQPGYDCLSLDNFVQNAPEGEYVCFPGNTCTEADPANCRPVGADCTSSEQCIDGTACIPEVGQSGDFTGFNEGYCLGFVRSTDVCPGDSSKIVVSNTDAYCMSRCEQGVVGSCGLGEACFNFGNAQAPAPVCWFEECHVDSECLTTICTAADTSGCGSGQACTNIAANGRGTCKTASKCDAQNPCPNGANCGADGECQANYCDAGLGLCLRPGCAVATGTEPDTCAEIGSVCNPTTLHCERPCTRDAQCAGDRTGVANAVCSGTTASPGFCVARCTKYNEADVCGATRVCEYASGKCQNKCSRSEDCGSDATCEASTGRCLKKCNAAGAPACSADKYCNATTGACELKCTLANEFQVCGATKLCQTWSGKCFSDCKTDAAICGDEACSVQVVDTTTNATQGFCAPSCTSDAQCGRDPNGFKLRCGSTSPKHCEFTACSATTPCAGTDVCEAGRCKAP